MADARTPFEPDSKKTDGEKRTRRGRGGITLADVARLANVAPITASRALNTPSQVSPDVLRRVRDAVTRTGYVPNILAGSLASNRSRLVAAVVPTVSGPVFLESVQALTTALRQGGYQLMLGQSGYSDSSEDELLEQIIGRRPDGIVLTGILHSAVGRRRLMAAGIPIVETWDLSASPIDMLVGFSHEKVGIAVADFLFDKYGGQVALMGADDARATQRETGFIARIAALRKPGRSTKAPPAVPVIRVAAPTTAHNGRLALEQLLKTAPDTRAVFCGSDMMALGVLTQAQIMGLDVPGRLAVVGFGDLSFSADLHPALTTVRIDGQAIGQHAARFILETVAGRDAGPRTIDVGFELMQRESA